MKRFYELNATEQKTAVDYAYDELTDLLEQEVIFFDRPVTDDVLLEYATVAAQEAYYPETGDKVVYDIVTESDLYE